jgi:BirA family transcriptional regulator, biotin operon repressor / biotin---[acetyl-CoA-carboxylase] ligase
LISHLSSQPRNPKEIELLRLLLPLGSEAVLAEIFERTCIRSADLPILVESLQQCGFIFNCTEKTISIAQEPELLIPEAILAGLRTTTIGRDVLVFRETSSTNDRIRQAGLSGAAEGLVIFAESQTSGRGSYGRKWLSAPRNGLWFSILLRTPILPNRWPVLVQMAAMAGADAVEKLVHQPVRIKPPNDLILGGGKLAGFLLETSNSWDFQVLGIGINVRSAPEIAGYPTSAVEQFSGREVSRAALAIDFLARFEEWYLRTALEEVSLAFERRVWLGRARLRPSRGA